MKTTIKNELINAILELCKQNNVDIEDTQIGQGGICSIFFVASQSVLNLL